MTHPSWNSGRLFRTSGSYWEALTLQSGVQLDVFTVVGEKTVSLDEICAALRADSRGTEMLLNALAAMGLLIKTGNRYSNTSESRALLAKGSPDYVGDIIKHHYHLVKAWADLPEAILSGKPVRVRSLHGEAQERESFLMGMFNLAMQIAPKVSAAIDLTGRRRLLDLGGGPGTYAIHFCLANPELRATVFDLPTTRPFALKTIERFGLSDRIEFVAGDYSKDEIRGEYDAVWLSHILHSEGPEECREIVVRAASAMASGGIMFIHEFILDDTFSGPLFPALFSLNMLINTENGQAYGEGQLRSFLETAGLKAVSRLSFRGPNDSSIICGTL